MARRSKDPIAQAASDMEKADKKRGNKNKVAPPSNVTEETIRTALDGIFAANTDMAKAKEVLDQANGVYRQKIKAAEQLGLDRKAILETVRLRKVEPGEHVSLLGKTIRYCAIMNMPVGTQLSMFLDAAEKAEVLPYNAGRLAAENREPSDNNPHEPGSQEFVDWDRGYMDKMQAMAPKAPTNGSAAHV